MKFIVRTDEKLTSFVEVESAIRTRGEFRSQPGEILSKLAAYENDSVTGSHNTFIPATSSHGC